MRLCIIPLFALCSLGCSGSDDTSTNPIETPDSSDTSSSGDLGTDTTTTTDGTSESSPDTTTVPDSAVDAGPPAVRFIGRFDKTDPSAPRFAWSGSAMHARFSGTSLTAKIKDPSGSGNFFEVVIDGKTSVVKTSASTDTYPLATGLAAGAHEVFLSRRDESFFGETAFLGFSFDSTGALLSPPPTPDRRIEVIGDSISAGYGDEGKDPCKFTADTENHYLTYEALAARKLGADLVTIAWSGMGMYRDYGGSTIDQMPVRYERTLPDRTSSPWDFSSWQPNAVIINLGTNDFAKGDPGKPFTDAYLAFVKNLRKHYASAHIFLALGPMLSGSSLTTARGYLNGIVDTMTKGGDANVHFMEFPTQLASDGYGCDWHPSLVTHGKMATVLETTLKTRLGW